MKLSQLISEAQRALVEHGDIDVYMPAADEGIDEDVTPTIETKCRPAGSPYLDQAKWSTNDHQIVFVIG